MLRAATVFTCDDHACNEYFIYFSQEPSPIAAEEAADEAGWYIEDGNDRCPKHMIRNAVEDQ